MPNAGDKKRKLSRGLSCSVTWLTRDLRLCFFFFFFAFPIISFVFTCKGKQCGRG